MSQLLIILGVHEWKQVVNSHEITIDVLTSKPLLLLCVCKYLQQESENWGNRWENI